MGIKMIQIISSSSCSQSQSQSQSQSLLKHKLLMREELSSRVISLFLDPSDTHLLSFPRASFSFAIFIPPTFHHFTI